MNLAVRSSYPMAIVLLATSHLAKPRLPIMMANVTMNGCILRRVMTLPASNPRTEVAPTAQVIASAGGHPASL